MNSVISPCLESSLGISLLDVVKIMEQVTLVKILAT
jgi:hypothetical protein